MGGLQKGHVESVADHTARTAFITMLICDYLRWKGVDSGKALRMAILHDLPEAVTMDLDRLSSNSIGKTKKDDLEYLALGRILSSLPSRIRKEYEGYFREYLDGQSWEARIVRLADRAEAYLQAREYEEMGFPTRFASEMRRELKDLINRFGLKRLSAVPGLSR